MTKFNEAFQKYLMTELEMGEAKAAMKHAFKRLKEATNLEDKERFLERCIVTKRNFDSLLKEYFETEKLYQKEIEKISEKVKEFEKEAENNIFFNVKKENDSN